MSAFDTQPGGEHYKDCAIQPTEYIHKNGLGFIQGNIVKYITRYKRKGGREDLLKAKHYIELLLELEYPQESRKMTQEEIAALNQQTMNIWGKTLSGAQTQQGQIAGHVYPYYK